MPVRFGSSHDGRAGSANATMNKVTTPVAIADSASGSPLRCVHRPPRTGTNSVTPRSE